MNTVNVRRQSRFAGQKGTILKSEDRLKQIENETISVALKNNLVKQTLAESENDALKILMLFNFT